MNLIARLRETRPNLSFPELLAVTQARAIFEGTDELRDERGDWRRVRVYTVEGHLFEGAPIIVPAGRSAIEADAIAQGGLHDTIASGLAALDATATEHTVEARPSDSDGLRPEDRLFIERALADVSKK